MHVLNQALESLVCGLGRVQAVQDTPLALPDEAPYTCIPGAGTWETTDRVIQQLSAWPVHPCTFFGIELLGRYGAG